MGATAAPESVKTAGWIPPAAFEQFQILQPLGRGGMGLVWLAKDRALDRLVAVKFIAGHAPSASARERFLVEARAIARLSHANVVSVFQIGEVGGRPYIAYEFVSGQSLDKVAVPVSWKTALRIAVGAARGLEAAHREGIVHRDIKPGNIILSDRGDVKLLDFGLAKLEETGASRISITTDRDAHTLAPTLDGDSRAASDPFTSSSRSGSGPSTLVSGGGGEAPVAMASGVRAPLTRPGAIMGTPAYMAPELWLGESANARTDVFALGLVLYELVAGRLPHSALEPDAIARKLVDEQLPPVAAGRTDVPESFAAVIDRAVRRQADERWPSAAELRAALDEVARVFLPATSVRETGDPDRVAVARSFARVREHGDAFVSRFYELLFAGGARALFPVEMGPQREKLLHMLDLATAGFDEPEQLASILTDLGRRHLHYSVTPAHFRILEKALIGALSEFDAAAWSDDLERAWRRRISFVETSMLRGMDSEAKTVGTALSVAVPRWPRTPPHTPPDSDPVPERRSSVPPEPIRTRYALNGNMSLAYQTFGSGPIDIVLLLGWLSHVELNWQHPSLASYLKRLAKLGRVLVFDKSGTGLSDRASETASLQDRIDDLRAVMRHAGVKRPLFVGISEGAAIAAFHAALFPEDTRGMVLYGATARMLAAPDYPWGHPPEFLDFVDNEIRQHWGEPVFVNLEAPSMVGDAAFCDWLGLYMRMSASPGNAIAMLRINAQFDIRDVLPMISVPSVVLHRKDDMVVPFGGGQWLAERLPGAQFVALEGNDHVPFVGDTESIHVETERFIKRLPDAAGTGPALRFVLGVAGDDVAFASSIAEKLQGVPVRIPRPGAAFAFDGAVRAARAALAVLAEARKLPRAVGLSVDAGPLDAALATRAFDRAFTRVGELPSVTALAASLAVGGNLSLVRLRDEGGETGMFVLDPG